MNIGEWVIIIVTAAAAFLCVRSIHRKYKRIKINWEVDMREREEFFAFANEKRESGR